MSEADDGPGAPSPSGAEDRGTGTARTATPPAAGTAARRARQQEQRAAQARGRSAAGARPATSPSAPGVAGVPADAAAARSAERATTRVLDPDRLAALEEERDFLLGSLADLEREHDAGDVDDGDYEALKDDYTARAASVLRSIEARHDTARAVRRPKRKGRGWLVATAVVVVGILAGVAVAQASGRRDSGQTLSGDIRQTTRDQLLQAQQLFADGKLLESIKVYDQVLAAQPANAEALTYKGWLLRLTANQSSDDVDRQTLLGKSLQLLDQAVQVDPGYADARVFRASLLNALNRPQDALADLDAVRPGSVPAMLDPLVGQLRSSIEQRIASGGGTTPGSAPPGSTPTS